MMRSAGRLPKPARAPKPFCAKNALSRSVRNLFQTGSDIASLQGELGADYVECITLLERVPSRRKPGHFRAISIFPLDCSTYSRKPPCHRKCGASRAMGPGFRGDGAHATFSSMVDKQPASFWRDPLT